MGRTNEKQFEILKYGLLVRAAGKINLSLLVKGNRPDGYHDIESIMAKIDWYDEILIEHGKSEIRNPKSEISNDKPETNIELICKGPYKVPEGEENLVYKAAEEILKIKNQKVKSNEERNKRLRITLTKNMPAGSGLGSGSSDAAATLMGINRFLKLGLGKREIAGLAAKLGSDVAFFLDGPVALCTGRGEKVKKLERCEFRVLLIVPDVSVSTKKVYENYRHDEAKYGRLSEEINIYIEKKRIESLGVRPVCLSGSGSSMFCIINRINEEGVKAYRDRIEKELSCRSIIVNNNTW